VESPMDRGVDGTQLSLSSSEFLPERHHLGNNPCSLFAFSIHLDSPIGLLCVLLSPTQRAWRAPNDSLTSGHLIKTQCRAR